LRNNPGAILDYDHAILLNNSSGLAYNNRGVAKINSGDITEGCVDLNKAVSLGVDLERDLRKKHCGAQDNTIATKEKEPLSLYQRGKSKHSQGDYAGALLDFDQAIKADPLNADLYLDRGVTIYMLDDYAKAIENFTKAIEINPQLSLAYINRGLGKIELNNKEAGCKDFAKAQELGNSRGAEMITKYCQ